MTDRRLAPSVVSEKKIEANHCRPMRDPRVCMSVGCAHERQRCRQCRALDCVHSLDAGVCAPCQVRDRSSGRDDTVAGSVVAHVFGGGVVEFIETIGPELPKPRRGSRR